MKALGQISAFLGLLSILFFGQSCVKPENEFPIEPRIAYKSYSLSVNDSGQYLLKLAMDFSDGDGDLGFSDEDTSTNPEDTTSSYNLFAEYYEKINGEFTQITVNYPFFFGDTIHYNGRLPILSPRNKTKAIKGEIVYDIDMGFGPSHSNTIKFRIHVYDRAMHKSNEIETPEITFP